MGKINYNEILTFTMNALNAYTIGEGVGSMLNPDKNTAGATQRLSNAISQRFALKKNEEHMEYLASVHKAIKKDGETECDKDPKKEVPKGNDQENNTPENNTPEDKSAEYKPEHASQVIEDDSFGKNNESMLLKNAILERVKQNHMNLSRTNKSKKNNIDLSQTNKSKKTDDRRPQKEDIDLSRTNQSKKNNIDLSRTNQSKKTDYMDAYSQKDTNQFDISNLDEPNEYDYLLNKLRADNGTI